MFHRTQYVCSVDQIGIISLTEKNEEIQDKKHVSPMQQAYKNFFEHQPKKRNLKCH